MPDPFDSEFNTFLLVRKVKVLAALQCLVQHSHLYRNIITDHPMADDWGDDFISPHN
jgi:hypothetical protein